MSSGSGRRQVPREFYARDTVAVARELLGCVLESRVGDRLTSGRIVEVEAYVGPDDPADHGFGGRRTARNAALFGPPGTAYVFLIYGMHWCFNAVTEREGYPAAVLIRALEPLLGIDTMLARRAVDKHPLLCSGPARLCESLDITGAVNATSLSTGPVRILRGDGPRGPIAAGPRVGISRAADWPLRFVERDSRWLSCPMG